MPKMGIEQPGVFMKKKEASWQHSFEYLSEHCEKYVQNDAFLQENESKITELCHSFRMEAAQLLLWLSFFRLQLKDDNRTLGSALDLLGINNCRFFSYLHLANDLVARGLLQRSYRRRGPHTAINAMYSIPAGVIEQISAGRKQIRGFMPHRDRNTFLREFRQIMHESADMCEEDRHSAINGLVQRSTRTLPLARKINALNLPYPELCLLLQLCKNIVTEGSNEVNLWSFDDLLTEEEKEELAEKLQRGSSELQQQNIVNQPDGGLIDDEDNKYSTDYYLIEDALNQLLPEVKLKADKSNTCIQAANIRRVRLFYNQEEAATIKSLCALLKPERFALMQKELKRRSMPEGLVCLLYGPPGTGKTESVMQLSRLSGRDLIRVDISSIKSKWVGESEKNLRRIFTSYRQQLKGGGPEPILLFNESDALIHSRLNAPDSAVEIMENAMQNILLQELEEFRGILFATSNLTCTLDPAFERRFLFKVKIDLPDAAVRYKLWQAKLPEIAAPAAKKLAQDFAFSGGQIDNIARKLILNQILKHQDFSLEALTALCQAEYINPKGTGKARPVGFI